MVLQKKSTLKMQEKKMQTKEKTCENVSNKGINDAIQILDGPKYFTNNCQNLTFP